MLPVFIILLYQYSKRWKGNTLSENDPDGTSVLDYGIYADASANQSGGSILVSVFDAWSVYYTHSGLWISFLCPWNYRKDKAVECLYAADSGSFYSECIYRLSSSCSWNAGITGWNYFLCISSKRRDVAMDCSRNSAHSLCDSSCP